jgi:hypothetical protein
MVQRPLTAVLVVAHDIDRPYTQKIENHTIVDLPELIRRVGL